jgi:hypothetical protein
MNIITSESGNVPFTDNIAQITEYASPNLFNPAPLPITITKNNNGTITITFPSTGWSFVVNLQSNQLISQNLSGANVTVESGFRVTIDFRITNTASSQDIYRLIISPVSASVTVTRDKNIPVSNNDSGDFISVTRENVNVVVSPTVTFDDPRFSPPPYPVTIYDSIVSNVFTDSRIEITINNTHISYLFFLTGINLIDNSINITNVKVTANNEGFIFQFPYKNGILGDRYEGKFKLKKVQGPLRLPFLDITVFRSKRAGISS